MVAVGLVGGSGVDVDEVDGLALVGDVGVGGHRDAVAGNVLEGDDRAAVELGGVECELDLNGAVGCLGRERRGGRHVVAIGVLDGAAVGAVVVDQVESAGGDVLGAGREALVGDGVGDRHLAVGVSELVLVHAALVGGGGVDGGHVQGLALVGDVGVGRDGDACGREVLEGDDPLAGEPTGVHVEGDRDVLGGGLGGERRGCRHVVAVGVLEGARVGAVVGYDVERAGDHVLVACGEVLHVDGVGDLLRGGGGQFVVARGVCRGGGVDGREAHGLALVGDVGVGGVGDALVGHVLEGNDGLPGEVGRVEVEGDLHAAVGGLGREGRGGRHVLAVCVLGHAAVGAVVVDQVERAGGGVGLAGGEARVLDSVGEGHVARGRGLMAGVALERGVDGRHGHGLALVGEVGVGGDLLARGVAHGLEGDQRASAELGRVDVEGLLGGADLGARHEVGGGGGHGAAVGAVVIHQVELTLEGVGRARRESLVGDLVDEAGAGGRRHALLALGVREGGPDGNGPLVDGSHVEVDAVARDGHGEAHEAVALVGLGPELLDGVGVIGEGA